MTELTLREADFSSADDLARVVALVDAYASDPMGGGTPLSAEVRERLPRLLATHPTAFAVLAFAGDTPVGVALCVLGLSSFAARPSVNLHDLAVLPSQRGLGIGRRLLEAVADAARRRDACKVTLEVRPDNDVGRHLYADVGFELSALCGQAYLMMEKPL